MTRVLRLDFRALKRDDKLAPYRYLIDREIDSIQMLEKEKKVRRLIDQMFGINPSEAMLVIERILEPHRSLK